jgi:hypothetical protein
MVNEMLFDSFVYCWTDTRTNMLYLGVHKGTQDDGYICSSKYMLNEYNLRSDDFSREIIAVGNYKEMLKFEAIILKSINAARDPLFYNKHNGDGRPYTEKHSEETKKKLSKPKTEEHKQKLRGKRPHVNQSGTKNNAYKKLKGKSKTQEFKDKNSIGQSKITWTVISPEGVVYTFKNLKKGCIDNNIPIKSITLWNCAKTGKPSRGWKCFKDSSRFDVKG